MKRILIEKRRVFTCERFGSSLLLQYYNDQQISNLETACVKFLWTAVSFVTS